MTANVRHTRDPNAWAGVLLGVLLVASSLGCSINQDRRVPPSEPPPIDDPTTFVAPSSGFDDHIGVIVASESVDVPSKVPGNISELIVGIGDSVALGDPIAKLDEDTLKEQLAINRADYRAALAQTRRASVALSAARKREQRAKKLGDVISGADVESAVEAVGRARASRAEASAAASSARVLVEQLERFVTQATITAPFAGKISVIYVSRGQSVTVGAPIVKLIASDKLRVDFLIPRTDRDLYAVGDKVAVAIEDSDIVIKGTIRRISPEVDPIAQMVFAQAELEMDSKNRKAAQAGVPVLVSPSAPRAADPEELN